MLPGTARFNPIPVELIASREMIGIKEDSLIIVVEEDYCHRSNQMSFGNKESPLKR